MARMGYHGAIRVYGVPHCICRLLVNKSFSRYSFYVERGAGVGSGFSDNEYVDAGASLIDNCIVRAILRAG